MSGGRELWTFNQTVEFLSHCDPQRAREAPQPFPVQDLSPESRGVVWGLLEALEIGCFHAVKKNGDPVPLSFWRGIQALLRALEGVGAMRGSTKGFAVQVESYTSGILIFADALLAIPAQAPAPDPVMASAIRLQLPAQRLTAPSAQPTPSAQPPELEDLEAAYRELMKKNVQNKGVADALVEKRFGQEIPEKIRRLARRNVGFTGKIGRPREPRK